MKWLRLRYRCFCRLFLSCAAHLCHAHHVMTAQPQNLTTTPANSWRCADCSQLRAAAVDESEADTAALKFVIENNLF
jgi:hypothetical protein